MKDCRLNIKELKHCYKRQLGHWRRTGKGTLNAMFTCCVRPTVCPHWLSDKAYNAKKSPQAVRRRAYGNAPAVPPSNMALGL